MCRHTLWLSDRLPQGRKPALLKAVTFWLVHWLPQAMTALTESWLACAVLKSGSSGSGFHAVFASGALSRRPVKISYVASLLKKTRPYP